MPLERFLRAQKDPFAGYNTALAEMSSGAKRSHWIWYILPQLKSLGRSATAKSFGILDLSEAKDYLQDPVLGPRYEEISSVIAAQLAGGVPILRLMNGETDALKLVSSVTLFRLAAQELATFQALENACGAILQFANSQGFAECEQTLAELSP